MKQFKTFLLLSLVLSFCLGDMEKVKTQRPCNTCTPAMKSEDMKDVEHEDCSGRYGCKSGGMRKSEPTTVDAPRVLVEMNTEPMNNETMTEPVKNGTMNTEPNDTMKNGTDTAEGKGDMEGKGDTGGKGDMEGKSDPNGSPSGGMSGFGLSYVTATALLLATILVLI